MVQDFDRSYIAHLCSSISAEFPINWEKEITIVKRKGIQRRKKNNGCKKPKKPRNTSSWGILNKHVIIHVICSHVDMRNHNHII